MYSPVIVFAYRRPEHLRNTLISLQQCNGFENTPIYVYCDGPASIEELPDVIETRKVAKEILGSNAAYHFSEVNMGLSNSVINGVREVMLKHERVIVVEDDLILDPSFLTYMNEGLNLYWNHEKILQISGYIFDIPELAVEDSILFLPFTSSWGWATWKRAWDFFDPNAFGWEALLLDKKLRHRFNLNGGFDYTTMMLRHFLRKCDSWAVRWYWVVFRRGGLVIFPTRTLVVNAGNDGTGTHGGGLLKTKKSTSKKPFLKKINWPTEVLMNDGAYEIICKTLARENDGWIPKLVNTFRWLQVKLIMMLATSKIT